jgi:hypothetical protein
MTDVRFDFADAQSNIGVFSVAKQGYTAGEGEHAAARKPGCHLSIHVAISDMTSGATLPGIRYSAGEPFASPVMKRWLRAG